MKKLQILAAACALAFGASAYAGSAGTTFQVTANVADDCTVTATDLNFGTYSTFTPTALAGVSTVTVACTLLAGYNVGLDAGVGSGATVSSRKMTKGGNALGYSLYRDPLQLLGWGVTPSVDTFPGVGTGLAIPHLVYGSVPAGQNVPGGTYVDTVTVSITY